MTWTIWWLRLSILTLPGWLYLPGLHQSKYNQVMSGNNSVRVKPALLGLCFIHICFYIISRGGRPTWTGSHGLCGGSRKTATSPRRRPLDSPASASPWEEQENGQCMWAAARRKTGSRGGWRLAVVADKQELPNALDAKWGGWESLNKKNNYKKKRAPSP